LRPDGTAHCWQPIGKADYVLPGSWLQVDVDSFFSNATVCGVRRDGSIECYGIQTNGTLSPAKIDQQTDPQRLPPAGAYLELAITSSTGCAIRRDGTIACWSTTGGAVPIPPSDFIARH
jgi:hypothetical protein